MVRKPLNYLPLKWEISNGERGIYVVNTIVWMKGFLGQIYFHFFRDSVPQISVMDYEVVGRLNVDWIQMDGITTAIGTKGFSLNVVRKIQLPVKIGSFGEFTP